MDNSVPQAFIFMKIGDYGGECLEDILERKQRERELDEKKRMFWGYSGTLVYPSTQAQPFSKKWVKKQGSIRLLMAQTDSNPRRKARRTIEYKNYSVDKKANEKDWKPLPPGVVVTYNNLALVIDEIEPVCLPIDLRDFEVGIGPSKGCDAAQYVRNQNSKACLLKARSRYDGPSVPITITYSACLKPPYAVFLR